MYAYKPIVLTFALLCICATYLRAQDTLHLRSGQIIAVKIISSDKSGVRCTLPQGGNPYFFPIHRIDSINHVYVKAGRPKPVYHPTGKLSLWVSIGFSFGAGNNKLADIFPVVPVSWSKTNTSHMCI